MAEWNARAKAGDDEAAQHEITARSLSRFVAHSRRSGMSEPEIAARVTVNLLALEVHRARNPVRWWRA